MFCNYSIIAVLVHYITMITICKESVILLQLLHKYKYVTRSVKIHHVSAQESLRFLNQVRAGRRPARTWFLEIAFVQEVSMRMCV